MTGNLTGWTETFWLALTAHLWQSTLVLLLVGLLARYMKNAPARVRWRYRCQSSALWQFGQVVGRIGPRS